MTHALNLFRQCADDQANYVVVAEHDVQAQDGEQRVTLLIVMMMILSKTIHI